MTTLFIITSETFGRFHRRGGLKLKSPVSIINTAEFLAGFFAAITEFTTVDSTYSEVCGVLEEKFKSAGLRLGEYIGRCPPATFEDALRRLKMSNKSYESWVVVLPSEPAGICNLYSVSPV